MCMFLVVTKRKNNTAKIHKVKYPTFRRAFSSIQKQYFSKRCVEFGPEMFYKNECS